MCKHEKRIFAGENTGPNGVYWCPKCGALIEGDKITLPTDINDNKEKEPPVFPNLNEYPNGSYGKHGW